MEFFDESMDLQKLAVGQMAKLNTISIQTLRLYDREGLLVPQLIDKKTGYRYYHIAQSARLDLIRHLKDCGMTLKEISEVLCNQKTEQYIQKLVHQKQVLEEKIEATTRNIQSIVRVLNNYERYKSFPQNGECFLYYIPERYILTYKSQNKVEIYSKDYRLYEYILRGLKQYMIDNNIALSYFSNVGIIIRKESFIHMGDRLRSHEVFTLVDTPADSANVEKLPAKLYYCTCWQEYDDEPDRAKILREKMEQTGYEIDGDYLCEVIMDFPNLFDTRKNMFYMMQVPVRRREFKKAAD